MDGFEVGRDDLRAMSDRLLLTTEDLRSVRGTWDSATVNGGAAFGTSDCGAAFTELQQRLFDALGQRVSRLGRLATSTVDSAAAYDHAESATARAFGAGPV
ncbi:hypothetical protein [Streptoalloteichus hindustanus]|uniref:Excreted virulence factor EspC, type VII ESX diderm n=1 Tax=Streptoalloteichus hindustanus TaxID=2017 RepID=A0A1M5FS72_STRHI|nr:hypothetical protein [Streptoalloteichus hindustanus]SHF94264.1 hypothetical protein SAMN05444320_105565 [Streptoalloteichus hindustanus]